MAEFRACSDCGEEKPLSDFYPRTRGDTYSRCKICERANSLRRYHAAPEKCRARMKDWYLRNQDRQKDYRKKYYDKNILNYREAAKEKYWRNKEKLLAQQAERLRKLRSDALKEYGEKCVCCGETTQEFLQIDHVNGSGLAHRKSIPGGNIYLWLKKNNYPKDGFRLLCANCNWARGMWGYCPHESLKAVVNE